MIQSMDELLNELGGHIGKVRRKQPMSVGNREVLCSLECLQDIVTRLAKPITEDRGEGD